MAPDLLPAWTRLVNDAIHEQCRLHPERFIGACQLPQDAHAPDTTHCLEELRRCVEELGFAGVYVSPDPEGRRNSPGLSTPYWYPLYEECERRQLPRIQTRVPLEVASRTAARALRVPVPMRPVPARTRFSLATACFRWPRTWGSARTS